MVTPYCWLITTGLCESYGYAILLADYSCESYGYAILLADYYRALRVLWLRHTVG